jgi:uncharacterized membrane protein
MKNIKQPTMFTFASIVLLLAILTSAMLAGFFYGWSASCIPGLRRVTDREYVAAMQSINRAILNPVFFIAFMGPLVLYPLSAWQQYGQPVSTRFYLLVAATIVYYIAFAVTIFGNVPLNNMLDRFNLEASEQAFAAQRMKYEMPWNRLHTIRTVIHVLAVALGVMACISPAAER